MGRVFIQQGSESTELTVLRGVCKVLKWALQVLNVPSVLVVRVPSSFCIQYY